MSALPDELSDAHGYGAVDEALAGLGLSRECLVSAAREGVLRRRLVSEFAPTAARGLTDWMARTDRLRAQLSQAGWTKSDPLNAPFTSRPDGQVLLGVMQGDKGTGYLSKRLVSSYPKGSITASLTVGNDMRHPSIPGIDEFYGFDKKRADASKVWFFVTRYEYDKQHLIDRVHAEIAQPEPTKAGFRVDSWVKRYCLEPFEFEPVIDPNVDPGDGPVVVPVAFR
jgi:hypothetical protein